MQNLYDMHHLFPFASSGLRDILRGVLAWWTQEAGIGFCWVLVDFEYQKWGGHSFDELSRNLVSISQTHRNIRAVCWVDLLSCGNYTADSVCTPHNFGWNICILDAEHIHRCQMVMWATAEFTPRFINIILSQFEISVLY